MSKKTNLKFWVLISVFFVSIACTTAAGAVIYVDANTPDNNDGSSWAKAYKYLQDGLADANSDPCSVEIYVADGNYYPDANTADPCGTGNRNATFQLINGVALYGGYAGYGVPNPDARDIQLYETILSGDLDSNDTPGLDPCDLPNDANRGENSYHVVTGSGTDPNAVLDGFTITAGNANGSYPHNCGGGMCNDGGSPIIANCIFTGNLGGDGGGMYNGGDSPMVVNCKFGGNSAGRGGGMYSAFSSPTVTNCTFMRNFADSYGGGMDNSYFSSPSIIDCVFIGNAAYSLGGGMDNYSSSPTVTGCTFIGNSADSGGGMLDESINSIITNCTFSGNSADYGGGISNSSSSVTLTNCILWGNTAGIDGNEIALSSSSTIDVNYCDIKGGQTEIYNDGTSTVTWGINIDADPLFVDANGPDGQIGTEDDNLRLSADSNCIDAGDNNSVPADTTDLDGDGNTVEPIPWDLDGRYRFADGDCNDTEIVDMGAYEFTYAYLGDFDGQCDVDFVDYAILANYWMTDEFLVDIAPTPAGDGIVDERDLDVLCDNWLAGK